jgi:hypothetical protein
MKVALMRWRLIWLLLVVQLGSGCARSVRAVLQPGDVARPEVAFAPQAPWPPGAAVAIGMLIRIDRPGGDSRYLDDTEVRDRPDMSARVTFFDGDRQLGDPIMLPFVRDC